MRYWKNVKEPGKCIGLGFSKPKAKVRERKPNPIVTTEPIVANIKAKRIETRPMTLVLVKKLKNANIIYFMG